MVDAVQPGLSIVNFVVSQARHEYCTKYLHDRLSPLADYLTFVSYFSILSESNPTTDSSQGQVPWEFTD